MDFIFLASDRAYIDIAYKCIKNENKFRRQFILRPELSSNEQKYDV